MADKDDGGSAFPVEGGEFSGLHAELGMSLRDWFAGQALPGILAQIDISHTESGYVDGEPLWKVGDADDRATVSEHAYLIADAMIAARSK